MNKIIVLIITCIALLLCLLPLSLYILWFRENPISNDPSQWHNFGGILSPVISLVTLVVTIILAFRLKKLDRKNALVGIQYEAFRDVSKRLREFNNIITEETQEDGMPELINKLTSQLKDFESDMGIFFPDLKSDPQKGIIKVLNDYKEIFERPPESLKEFDQEHPSRFKEIDKEEFNKEYKKYLKELQQGIQ